jgi:hypothetical protein
MTTQTNTTSHYYLIKANGKIVICYTNASAAFVVCETKKAGLLTSVKKVFFADLKRTCN